MSPIIPSLRFGKAVAAHHLRGSFAGRLDSCEAAGVRGWIYDARRPKAVLELEVLLDGQVVETTSADVYRADLAAVFDDEGLHGFECTVPAFASPSAVPRAVTLRVADRPRVVIGPLPLPPNRSPLEMPSRDVPPGLHARLLHIFDHVSAVHEHSLRRMDEVYALVDARTQGYRTAADGGGPSRLYTNERSGISGVGAFHPLLDFDKEVALFQTRLEADLHSVRHLD